MGGGGGITRLAPGAWGPGLGGGGLVMQADRVRAAAPSRMSRLST